MGYYPIFLELSARRCVVLGAGAVAERKVEELLAMGARVTVISPAITDRLRELLADGSIRYVERTYQEGDLAACDLVFAATDDPAINAAAFREARAHRIWINSADDTAHCDFILPGLIRRGDLTAGEVRRRLREKSLSVSGPVWNKALKGDFRRLIREGRTEEARTLLIQTLETNLCA